jgi:lysophospholipase L1-like esterase
LRQDLEKLMERIRVLTWLMMLSLVPKCSVAAEVVHVAATDQAISYVGRWGAIERAGQTSMATVNSSSQLYFTFSGQHIVGLFDLDGIHNLEQIDLRVDQGDWALFTIDRPRIDFFPAGLPAGKHRLEIAVKAVDGGGSRWLAPLSGVIFRGFELEPGAHAEVNPTAGEPLLEFFGDSITQGDEVLQGDGSAVINSDALATYAWLAGEALGTTHVQITFGGQGVIRSDSREVPPAALAFPWNFSGSHADFSVVPDFIVINLGLNDQADSSSEFIEAYVGYLREIRKYCPKTRIFALRPFHGDRYHGDDVAEAVRRMEDPAIAYIDTAAWLDESDYTDGVHPNLVGQRKAGTHLEQILKPFISLWKSEKASNKVGSVVP